MFKFHINGRRAILIGAVLAIGLLAGAPGLPAGGSAPPGPDTRPETDTGVGDTGPAPLADPRRRHPEPPVAGPGAGPTSAQHIAPDAPSRRPLTRAELAELLADVRLAFHGSRSLQRRARPSRPAGHRRGVGRRRHGRLV